MSSVSSVPQSHLVKDHHTSKVYDETDICLEICSDPVVAIVVAVIVIEDVCRVEVEHVVVVKRVVRMDGGLGNAPVW